MNGFLIIVLIFVIIIILSVAKYLLNVLRWKRQGIEVVNILYLIKKATSVHLYQIIQEIYQKMCADGKPFQVIEMLLSSAVVIRDQDAIKDVLITKFEYFAERGLYVNDRDPLLGNLIRLEYRQWKPLRKKLSPCFSPAKVKYMFNSVVRVSEQLIAVLKDQSCQGNAIVEMHDICSRFAIDVIGDVAFGIECNSLKDAKAEFKIQGGRAVRDHFNPIFDLLGANYPRLMKLFNKKYHNKDTIDFFTNLIRETVKHREKHNIRRHDFVDILMELNNDRGDKDEVEITPELMVSQAFLFFAAGYESTSVAMTEALYELAKNCKIQEKARAEILTVMAQHNGKLSYENLSDLKYLKQICQEILRKYPLVHTIPRKCTRPCTLYTSEGSLHVIPGTTVLIPVYAIHHNAQFYPNPDIFCPERFDDEQKITNQPPCTFLAFGEGPKICIAERFGMMELQYGLASLLSQFRFTKCDQTPTELVFDKKRIVHLGLENVIYLQVEAL